MPLLKGGGFGFAGTAPIVFAAAMAMQDTLGRKTDVHWEELVKERLGCYPGEFMKNQKEDVRPIIAAEIMCPKCSK